MAREGHKVINGNVHAVHSDDTPFLWEKVDLYSGKTVHVNRITRDIVLDPTRPEFIQARALTRRGGILADEMGLGKTVW